MKKAILSIAFSIAACSLYAQSGGPAVSHKEMRKELPLICFVACVSPRCSANDA
jgi:hypothetical protein